MDSQTMIKGAKLSACGTYRYKLWRLWDSDKPNLMFIMLNPSTADADTDDATIRKCVSFARVLGYGGICVVNLFALRATDPKMLYTHSDPVGKYNDASIYAELIACSKVICAWGTHGKLQDRDAQVLRLLQKAAVKTYCLKRNANGSPSHPLYLPLSAQLQLYTGE